MDIILLYGAIFFGILAIIIITGEGYLDIGLAIILTAVIIGAGFLAWAVPTLLVRNRPPKDYYETAEEYINSSYGEVPNQNLADLENFLMKIDPFPSYNSENFTCSETTARLEWLLEGAGFNASISISGMRPNRKDHSWVVVEFTKVDNVHVEATSFTKNRYNPPGLTDYSGFESRIFDSLKEIISNRTRSEWDWWNVNPYKNIKPYSGWE